ncbi:MAG: ATP-binding protein [Deltaproteobacteria bacterium]|nr:ATP-binding protein [Deltaproteobacteria bacterium]
MAVNFIDREQEMEGLARLWEGKGPQLHVTYGRRRVGKSALLRHFLQGRPAVVFQAAEVGMRQNLTALMERAAVDLGRAELAGIVPRDIEAALGILAATRASSKDPLGVVLDEFPNMLVSDIGTASLVQRFVDSLERDDGLRLFLCGSAVRTMEAEILGHKSPLYGRRTGQLRLAPLPYEAWRPFCPRMSNRDRLWVHAATGGVPAYLVPIEGATTAREALLRLFFQTDSLLLPEADFLLRTELSVVHTYASILRAVAAGATRMQEIAERVGTDSRTISRYLPVLIDLGYVRRETSLDEPAPEKSRKGRYFVVDALLRFHFRFVQPNREVIERGDGEALLDQVVAPVMPTFAGPVYESVMRERLAADAASRFGSPVLKAGRLYGAWGEIDVALQLMDGTWVLCECKAAQTKVSAELLDAVRLKAAKVTALSGQTVRFCLASLGGFTKGLKARAESEGVLLSEIG